VAFSSGALACSDATSPSDPDVRFVVESQPSSPLASASNSTASAAGGPGVVVVIGRTVLPSPCYTLSPRVQRTGQTLDLTVVAQSTVASCFAVVTSQGYTLRVGSLAAGTYHVRMTHEIEGPITLRELVLEMDVRVD
jgi:hypothetical protein